MFKSMLKSAVAIAATPITVVVDATANVKDCIVGDTPRGLKNTKAVTDLAAENFKNAVEPLTKK